MYEENVAVDHNFDFGTQKLNQITLKTVQYKLHACVIS